jgi:ankyrin repeat protein
VKEKRLDVNVLDAAHRTPVYIAASNGKVEAVKELLSFHADVTIPDDQVSAGLLRRG